ncbi:MAG TPA: galactose-1-phosphate uridylyltransferase, partial [Clostridiales bacterium]|nr:galactose-1-phosphate uridylyltransferase [Clostridiales bacterium]
MAAAARGGRTMPLSTTEQLLASLVQLAISKDLITADDRFFAVNRLIARLQIDTVSPELGPSLRTGTGTAPASASTPEIIDALVDDAVRRGVCADLSDLQEILAADLMTIFLDKPSSINSRFWQIYRTGPRQATDWFYRLSRDSNYIQTASIARNICYQAPSTYGDLDITINLSKPEKNPRDIAAAKTARSSSYPLCLLCAENEGYAGRAGYPARANHRMIRLALGGEPWYIQYSPYSYYNEHCIVLAESHRDMKIDRMGFQRLLEFITLFPHYFVGSNADLPIVGGSILTHDHYQGGRFEFAMARAGEDFAFALPDWPAVKCSVVRWPMSVL